MDSDSDDDPRITAEDLVIALECLIQRIKNKSFAEVALQDIYDSIEEYITTSGPRSVDPNALKYLFRGWWLTSIIEGSDVHHSDSTPASTEQPSTQPETQPASQICPYCLKLMEK